VEIVRNQILSIVTCICSTKPLILLWRAIIWKTTSFLSSHNAETVCSHVAYNVCKRSVWLLSSRRMSLTLGLLRSCTKWPYRFLVRNILMDWLSILHSSKRSNLLLYCDSSNLSLQHIIMIIQIRNPWMCQIIAQSHKFYFITIFFPIRHVQASNVSSW
jgi:hypothetical protein